MKNDNQGYCYISKDQSVTIEATDRDVARMVCALLWHLAKHDWPVMSAYQYMVCLRRVMGDPMAAPGFDKGTVVQWGDALVDLQKDHVAILQVEVNDEVEDDEPEEEEEDEPDEALDEEENDQTAEDRGGSPE